MFIFNIIKTINIYNIVLTYWMGPTYLLQFTNPTTPIKLLFLIQTLNQGQCLWRGELRILGPYSGKLKGIFSLIEDTKHESLYKPKYPHVGGERTGGELGAWVEGAKEIVEKGRKLLGLSYIDRNGCW